MTSFVEVLAELQQRWEPRMEPDLTRITDLLDLLGSPERAYPSVHITGTNGKTSTARMVDSLLRALGLHTGRLTSPHLESVTERVALEGEPLSPERFAAAYDDIAPAAALVDERHAAGGGARLSYFELLVALGLAALADAPVDVGVVEVGLEGLWDATNVLRAPVVAVGTVSLDHTDLLGPDVGAIAAETAGVIHPGAVAVLALQPPAAAAALLARAGGVGATVVREGLDFGLLERRVALGGQGLVLQGLGGVYDDIHLPLHGAHQGHNAALALAAVESFLGARPGRPLDLDAVRAGFAAADSPGRLEVVRRGPTVLLDGAHNPAGARALVAALEEAFAFDRLVGVVGVQADKDARSLLEALEPVLATVVCTRSSSPRALSADDLGALAVDVFGGDRVEVAPALDDALELALQVVEDDPALVGTAAGGIIVTGSLVTVGEARALLRRR